MAKTDSDVVRVGGASSGLDRYFKISERGSTVRTEIGAGVTTWLTMAYILFLNPAILGAIADHEGTSLDAGQVLSVTALVAGVLTLAMGLYANYPFALAAGLGLNGFVAFGLVASFGLTWPEAMGVIVLEGVIITVLVLTNVRELIMDSIPMDLKRAIGIGIGLFIALIGLVDGGVVVKPEGSPLPVGLAADFSNMHMLVFVIGLALSALLVSRKVKGGLLIAIVGSTVAAIVINQGFGDSTQWANGVAVLPSDWVTAPQFDLVGKVSFGFLSALGAATTISIVLAVMMSDFFDTMGTATALGSEAGLLDENGKLPDIKKVLLVDSLAAVAGGATSSSSNTTYIESASGVAEGGRTGLTSAVTGVLFLGCLLLSSIAGVIPYEATGPVLVIVGFFMMQGVGEIDWRDPGIAIPAFLTIILMPFTYSITNGVGAGFLAFVFIRVAQGRAKDVHWLLYVIAALFAYYFFHGVHP